MSKRCIIKKPIFTEKSLREAASGVYTFEVDKKASKRQIKEEIEKMFDVHVSGVNTSKLPGKKRRAGKRRLSFKTPEIKKARVTLLEKETIDLFEIGEQT